MKKEKSGVVLSVMGGFVTLFLILSAIFQSWGDDCIDTMNTKRDIKDQLSQDYVSNLLMYYQGVTLFAIKNSSSIFMDVDKVGINHEGQMSFFWDRGLTVINKINLNITNLNYELTDLQSKCNCNYLWGNIFLYLGIVMAISAIVYNTLIYQLYKT